jgi:hypothetical protein
VTRLLKPNRLASGCPGVGITEQDAMLSLNGPDG